MSQLIESINESNNIVDVLVAYATSSAWFYGLFMMIIFLILWSVINKNQNITKWLSAFYSSFITFIIGVLIYAFSDMSIQHSVVIPFVFSLLVLGFGFFKAE